MIKHCYFSCGCQPDKMASKTIIIIIIFYIYKCTCTVSFVVTEAEEATAAVLFEEASWAANMESGSRPSKVSALAWIKLSGSTANDALDVLGDAAFNFLSGLSIFCKKKRNIWINFVVAHIQSLHKSLFVVLIFKALKKEITWKNNSKYDQSTLANKFLNLASPGGKSQTVQSNIIWLLNEGWKIILQSWEMKVV